MDLYLNSLSLAWLVWTVPSLVCSMTSPSSAFLAAKLLMAAGGIALLDNLWRCRQRGWGWKFCRSCVRFGKAGLHLAAGLFREISGTDSGSGEWDDP